MKLSIVIVNYNVEHFLEQCLLSVHAAIGNVESEVWVVDNASVDGSLAMMDEKFPWVKRIDNKDNVGFSVANNQAIELSSGEYVLLLNPDTVVEETTFEKVVEFMDSHPDAGGLGVKMVDGKGKFLPESKRGLPTPWVSFYKIFGVSRLFKKSERFNRYHLGHLSKDETHSIEILSGAFMLMRKKALDEVGLLDETFFMYGEDIDLSWRLIQGGYKNYYFADTTIIHYKGESTKKGSLNYVFVFYRAMVIFAKKHFSEKNASLFSFFINMAIYLRAGLAIAGRVFRRVLLPVLEFVLFFFGLLGIKKIYSQYTEKIYDDEMVQIGFAVYSLIWVISLALFGAYRKKGSVSRVVKGVLVGFGLILLAYSLLPETLRFSRALIVLGTIGVLAISIVFRKLLNVLFPKFINKTKNTTKNYLVIGEDSETKRVGRLLDQTRSDEVNIQNLITEELDADISSEKLDEMIRVFAIDELIFCAKNISSAEIIKTMSRMEESKLDIKIAPPESLYIIGSSSIDKLDDLLAYDVNSVSKPKNRRLKRGFDIVISFLLIPLLPILLFVVKRPLQGVANIFKVLTGAKTWVGYAPEESTANLPKLKPAVLSPDLNLSRINLDSESKRKINLIYAKDYKIQKDFQTIFKNLKHLGN